MFRKVDLESQKELFLKSSRLSFRRKEKPITDKITNITYTKEYEPQNKEISSRQRYQSFRNSLKPYNDKNNLDKLNKLNTISPSRDTSKKGIDDTNSNISRSKTIYSFRNPLYSDKYKTEYRSKRTQSFFSNRINDKEYILRTTNISRLRKLYSMSSDIFNLDDCSTNLVHNNSFYDNNNYNFNTENIDNNNDNKEYNDDNEYYDKNNTINISKGLLEKEKDNIESNVSNMSNISNIKRVRNININKIKNIEGKYKIKRHHKLSLLLNKDFNNSDFIPFLHKIKNRTKSKTNASNIESVNYDIISNKENHLYDKYNTLSNKKADNTQYDNYEIIIPKNYNKLDSSKLKNFLHAEGIHFFGFKEQANLIGDKGKFTFKIRKSNLDNLDKSNKNKNIELLSKKLKNVFSVKLKKNEEDNKRKTTEATKKYGGEVVSNHLQDNEKKSLKK